MFAANLNIWHSFFLLGEFNDVKFSAYRTAMKLRVLQKKLCCKYLQSDFDYKVCDGPKECFCGCSRSHWIGGNDRNFR